MPDTRPWRTGRSWGRTIVIQTGDQPGSGGEDELIGVAKTPDVAEQAVHAVNTGEPIPGQQWRALGLLIFTDAAYVPLGQIVSRWDIAMFSEEHAQRIVNAVNGQQAPGGDQP